MQQPKQGVPSHLLSAIKEKLSSHVGGNRNINNELADVLNLSVESVYRRFRGDASFTLDEIYRIQQLYDVDLMSLLGTGKGVRFDYSPFYRSGQTVDDYLNRLLVNLQHLEAINPTLHVVASDIPLFRFMGYPALRNFKMYYWRNLVQPVNGERDPTYGNLPEAHNVCANLHQTYNNLNVQEIWTRNTLNGTIDQIDYYYDCGAIPSQDVLFLLYQDMVKLVEDIFYANTSERTALYMYELSLNSNSFYVEAENGKYLSLGVNSINALHTEDDMLMAEYKLWLDVVYSKSFKISGQSKRLRHNLYQDFIDQISNSAKDRLNPPLFAKLV